MPRPRIPMTALPRRPDRRRSGGNGKDAQRRRGQTEAIAERRAIALELRKAGSAYRAIAQQLGVDVHTAHADVAAELGALRETTIGHAEELRALELERFDRMLEGLWPKIRDGNPPAVLAAVRVAERRSRLLGLDALVVTKSELTGSLGVYAERLAAERAVFEQLDLAQLEELAAASQALVDRALAMVRGHQVQQIAATVLGAPVGGESTDAPAEMATGIDVEDA